MKRVLFIGRQETHEKNDVKLLAELLATQLDGKLEVDQAYFENVVVEIDDVPRIDAQVTGDATNDINDYDLVVMIGWSHSRTYTDLAHAIALYCQANDVQVWNSELVTARSMTKLSQLVVLSLQKFVLPRSVFSLNQELALRRFRYDGRPLVCKDIEASRGRRNYIVKSAKEQSAIARECTGLPMLWQEYIENDNSDVRFMVVGGKVALAIQRTSSGQSHLTNLSAGGTATLAPLDSFQPALIEEVENVAGLFRRELCGIDYMFDTKRQRYVFLEINLTPQLVNGAFVREKIKAISDVLVDWQER